MSSMRHHFFISSIQEMSIYNDAGELKVFMTTSHEVPGAGERGDIVASRRDGRCQKAWLSLEPWRKEFLNTFLPQPERVT